MQAVASSPGVDFEWPLDATGAADLLLLDIESEATLVPFVVPVMNDDEYQVGLVVAYYNLLNASVAHPVCLANGHSHKESQ